MKAHHLNIAVVSNRRVGSHSQSSVSHAAQATANINELDVVVPRRGELMQHHGVRSSGQSRDQVLGHHHGIQQRHHF